MPYARLIAMISDRQGVEIDFCPRRRGVWLDRSELQGDRTCVSIRG
jgi:Zn-finger nucleic acid-binding protein